MDRLKICSNYSKYNYASPAGLYLNYSPYNPGLHPGLNYIGLTGLKHLHAEDVVTSIEYFLFLLRNIHPVKFTYYFTGQAHCKSERASLSIHRPHLRCLRWYRYRLTTDRVAPLEHWQLIYLKGSSIFTQCCIIKLM